MEKHYGGYTLNEVYSFFMDCLGDKLTEESYYRNKKKLGINGNSEQLFFDDNGIVKKFFRNFDEKKIEHVITDVFFKSYYKDSKKYLVGLYPDDNNIEEFYIYGVYNSMWEIQNNFNYSIFDDTYKIILTESGFKYDVFRNWEEFDNKKTLDSIINLYEQIENPFLKERFLLHSLVLNIKGAMSKLFKLTIKEKSNLWLGIKNKSIPLPTKNPLKSSHSFHKDVQQITNLFDLKIDNYNEIEESIEVLATQHPYSKNFFCNWFYGQLLILKSEDEFDNKDEILDYYKKAFEAINFAGPSTALFIEISLATSIHLESKLPSDLAKIAAKDATKKAENNGINSIFSNLSKRIYNYSLLLGFNEKRDKNDFSLIFFDDIFYSFFHNKHQKNNFNGVSIQTFAERNLLIEKFKNANLKTVKELVKITAVSYTPIVGLMFLGDYKSAFDLLNKFWDEPGKNGYKVIEQPANNNTTPLIQLLTYFKNPRLSQRLILKDMIMRLIDSYSIEALKLRTNRSTMREPIQEAIHTCDIEILTAILDKTGMDIDSYEIGLDDQSILEYTLGLQVIVPRFNNGLPHTGESSVKLDRIIPNGITKSQREKKGIASLNRSKQEFNEFKKSISEDDFNEYYSIELVGESTRQDFLEISDMIIKRSTNKKYKDIIDMFHRDTEVINSNIERLINL
jgi:hypothetical protein